MQNLLQVKTETLKSLYPNTYESFEIYSFESAAFNLAVRSSNPCHGQCSRVEQFFFTLSLIWKLFTENDRPVGWRGTSRSRRMRKWSRTLSQVAFWNTQLENEVQQLCLILKHSARDLPYRTRSHPCSRQHQRDLIRTSHFFRRRRWRRADKSSYRSHISPITIYELEAALITMLMSRLEVCVTRRQNLRTVCASFFHVCLLLRRIQLRHVC